jgi:hypothetical protein
MLAVQRSSRSVRAGSAGKSRRCRAWRSHRSDDVAARADWNAARADWNAARARRSARADVVERRAWRGKRTEHNQRLPDKSIQTIQPLRVVRTRSRAQPGSTSPNTNGTQGAFESGRTLVLSAIQTAAGASDLRVCQLSVGNDRFDLPVTRVRTQNFIGKNLYGDCVQFKGRIGELLVYSRALSSTDAERLEAYLRMRWNACG